MAKNESKTYTLALCALFTALLGVFSQIVIPIGPVPVNVATLAVYCGALLLGPQKAALSVLVWVLLGGAGLPVFALFKGGISTLAGPTGGFIIGYVPMSLVIGLINQKGGTVIKKARLLRGVAMGAGISLCFALGTARYMAVTGSGLWPALTLCVWPFIPGEGVKIFLAEIISRRVQKLL